MPTPSKSEQITKVLRAFTLTSSDIEAAAIVDDDGLLIASALPSSIEEDRVAAMSAALLGISERIAKELSRGNFSLVLIRCSLGYAVVSRCGTGAVLTTLTTNEAKLGLLFLEISRTSQDLAKLL